MNDIPSPKSFDHKVTNFSRLLETGHMLRGEFMNHCASVEDWMTKALVAARHMDIDVKKPYLFGQKLAALNNLAQAEINPFRKPKAVLERLAEMEKFAQMRAWMGHSIMKVTVDDEGTAIFGFTLPGNDLSVPGQHAKSIDQASMEKLNASLKQLAKLINDQKLKSG